MRTKTWKIIFSILFVILFFTLLFGITILIKGWRLFETAEDGCKRLGYEDGIYHNELKGSPLECWNRDEGIYYEKPFNLNGEIRNSSEK